MPSHKGQYQTTPEAYMVIFPRKKVLKFSKDKLFNDIKNMMKGLL